MIGQLMVAMLDAFSQALSNSIPFYIEFKTMALSICLKGKQLAVLVFHDPSDGPRVGRFIAYQVMNLFCELFPTPPEKVHQEFIQKRLHSKLSDVFRGTRRDLLIELAWSPGIRRCFLLRRIQISSLSTSSSSSFSLSSVQFNETATNSLTIETNFDSLWRVVEDVMSLSHPDEYPGEIILEAGAHRIFVFPVTFSLYLVVVTIRSFSTILSSSRSSASSMSSSSFSPSFSYQQHQLIRYLVNEHITQIRNVCGMIDHVE